ncbi:MAG: sugar phosphate isomerase/epimerase, partial [Candidatus Bathyarchaeia archaeon]
EYAKSFGVSAVIENVPEPFPFVMKSVEEFDRFYDEVGVEAFMVLDVAHAHLRGEELEFIKRFEDRISHVHVSDNHGDGDTHLRIGEGSVAWGEVIEALRGSPFDGWVTIESHGAIAECVRLLEGLK